MFIKIWYNNTLILYLQRSKVMYMKTFIMIMFMSLTSLSAYEQLSNQYSKIAQISDYRFCVANLKFVKEDEIMPGLTVGIEPKSLKRTDFRLTYARTFTVNQDSTLKNIKPTDKALFAQLNYKF